MSTFLNKITLRRPEQKDREHILDMIREFQEVESEMAGLWNFAETETDYEDWLEANSLQEVGLLEKGIPAIQLVAFDETNYPLGFLNLRLRLNDALLAKGGHIGYSVRPSMRCRGIAKEMLKQGISLAHIKNINTVLVTCHQNNIASRSIILANGGQYENSIEETERYWIRKNNE